MLTDGRRRSVSYYYIQYVIIARPNSDLHGVKRCLFFVVVFVVLFCFSVFVCVCFGFCCCCCLFVCFCLFVCLFFFRLFVPSLVLFLPFFSFLKGVHFFIIFFLLLVSFTNESYDKYHHFCVIFSFAFYVVSLYNTKNKTKQKNTITLPLHTIFWRNIL